MKQGIKMLAFIVSLALCLGAAGFAQQICDDGSVNPTTPKTLIGGGSRDPGSLTTLFASNNQYAGNMFDITPAVDLEFTSIDINTSGVGVTCIVDVYYRKGTCIGYENSSTGWTLLASSSGTGAGIDNATKIDLSGNGVVFDSGQVYGIYVDLSSYTSGVQALRYTNGSATTYSNADLSLTSHCGKGTPAFTGSTFPDRIWNGTIHYNTLGGFTLAIDQLVGGQTTTLKVSGAVPNDTVTIAYSVNGGGPTPTPWGQALLTPPVTRLPNLIANSQGEASISRTCPNVPGAKVWLQALDVEAGVLSNGLAESIQ